MATSALFEASKLKVERAKKHIEELTGECDAYLSRDPYVSLLVLDKTDNSHSILMDCREHVPQLLGLILGDVVYNLRSSLDILANDIVSLCGAKPHKVYFPFADSADALEDQIKTKMRGATKDALDIIRTLNPYRGGNEYLRALHDLNIRDKHIELLSTSAGQSIEFDASAMVQIAEKAFMVDLSKIPTTYIDPAGFTIQDNEVVVGKIKSCKAFVHIGEGLPLAGKPVIEALAELISIVQGIIAMFESHFIKGN